MLQRASSVNKGSLKLDQHGTVPLDAERRERSRFEAHVEGKEAVDEIAREGLPDGARCDARDDLREVQLDAAEEDDVQREPSRPW